LRISASQRCILNRYFSVSNTSPYKHLRKNWRKILGK
jgi:hypothetical protein